MYRALITRNVKDLLDNQLHTTVIEWTWDENGNRIERETKVPMYLYYEDINNKNSKDRSLFDKGLTKLEFNTNWDRNKWIEAHKNIPLYEKQSPVKQYLLDTYFGQERKSDFQKFPFRIFALDIEVEIGNCFPEPANADYPINVISLYDTLDSQVHVWCYKSDIDETFSDDKNQKIIDAVSEYDKTPKVNIYKFKRETDLLRHFLKYWENHYPDIVTGWNIDRFDMIYIINRIIKLFGDGEQYRLSPANKYGIKKPVYAMFEKPQKGVTNGNPMVIYRIQGLSICDYINLYKKFAGTSRQSFKLDYIANLELGVGKLDYYELGYESMKEFMEKDFPTFVQYNLIDTVLIKLLDNKLKFISLMRTICNIGLVEYESIFQSIPYILGALCAQARYEGKKFLTDANKSEEHQNQNDGYEGAFVFPTKMGYYKAGISSFDFNSLYPNIMMSLNISPDTKVGRILTEDPYNAQEIEIRKINGQIETISQEQFKELIDKKCTIAANNVLYVKPAINFGIVPTFLDWLYTKRKSEKNERKKTDKMVKRIDDAILILERQLKKCENE